MEPTQVTYAEIQGYPTFDWNEYVRRNNHTQEEIDEASELASIWVTCACGNQCAIIPRDELGAPLDGILDDGGFQFYLAIGRDDMTMARKQLRIIEKRAAELILQLTIES